ncbi:glycosyltransferase involved in cell wall biosynthesis [Brevundimonas sp. UYEF29]|uniref:glycosyltransferase family 4 protein n=1 Tax=Brevundimonas sp. UYEF29 TaxID=3156346 RepID=UPI003392B7F7
MKIGIVSSTVPHVKGGYRNFVDQLEPHLIESGHQVERIWMPFTGNPKTIIAEMATFRAMDLSRVCDMVICARPPAHVIRHPRKVLWFIHHERIFYDLWDSDYNTLNKTAYWSSVRENIFQADTLALKEAHAVFSNSAIVAARLKKFNGVEAEVLYPPVDIAVTGPAMGYGGELLFVCRIEHHKRQHLAIEAIAHTKTPVRLRIAGESQNAQYLASLHELVRFHGLQNKITIDSRWISEGEKGSLLSQALAAVYIPVDEDSYGYPPLEAAHYRRATVTVQDAGGVGELVVDGLSGLMAKADPQAVGAAFDRLWLDRKLAKALGQGAHKRIAEMNINWRHVVSRLTA